MHPGDSSRVNHFRPHGPAKLRCVEPSEHGNFSELQGAPSGELRTSNARTVAAPLVSTPSFSNISCTCFFTVDSVIPRIVATSELVLPWESQSNVSAARGVRPSFSRGSAEEKLGLNSRLACCW